MSIPRPIGWAVFCRAHTDDPPPLKARRSHIYGSRNQALAAHFYDGVWEYGNQGLSPAEILEKRREKVLARYDIKEIFIHD